MKLYPNRIYLYECADTINDRDRTPIVRQRCGKHIELTGPLRIVRILDEWKISDKYTCYECEHLKRGSK